jgi:two-component system sensor histidine kinase KdpD
MLVLAPAMRRGRAGPRDSHEAVLGHDRKLANRRSTLTQRNEFPDNREMTPRWVDPAAWVTAVVGPPLVTAALFQLSHQTQRDYIFIYLGLVAVVAVLRGLWQALLCGAISFLFVDYFFVPPIYTFTIADETDLVNLSAFLATAVLVGLLASRRRNTQLRAEAALRLARSEHQINALRETDRTRRELLANVSHELRTPLGTILTESTDPSYERNSKEMRKAMTTIAAEARRLSVLVADMLDVTMIEGGALELDLAPVDLGDAIEAAAERLHHVSPDREVTWDGEASGVMALADWDRLGQILDNLLSNADRFAPPHTPIEANVRKMKGGLVSVRVIDQGPGIPANLREHIFERFFRGQTDGAGSGGTGLGLAIVKGLVEAHAGTVTVDEGRDHGAVFRFTLPEARPNESHPDRRGRSGGAKLNPLETPEQQPRGAHRRRARGRFGRA